MIDSERTSTPTPSTPADRRRLGRRGWQAAAAPRAERMEFEQWDFGHLSRAAETLYRTIAHGAGMYAVGGTIYLLYARPMHALAFASIAVAGWLCLEFWLRAVRLGVPAFAALAAPLSLLNSLPLLSNNAELQGLSSATIQAAALTVALFLAVLVGGWRLGVQALSARPSTWNLLQEGASFAGGSGLKLSLPLLGLAVIFKMSVVSGLLFRVLPGNLAGIFPVLQAFAGAATLLGAFLGGLAVAGQLILGGATIFWTLFAFAFLLDTSSILLSTAGGLVIACGAGLGLRQRRIPWVFLIVLLLVVGFLNQGKHVMRGRYWNMETGEQQRISLTGLPAFYAEWADVSLAMFRNNWQAVPSETAGHTEAGQSLLGRLGNFQNLTFIVDNYQQGTVPPLYGQTYTLIPALLIPRVFWPNKPRTHEGQILLNLHFGRQASEEETERTYITWGLLPEAVGNFGCVGGALFLGLVAGFLCGGLESWSARKRLLSVEGLMAVALLVLLAGSYEMVASVLITAIFQMLVAVVTFGILLRLWFRGSSPVRVRRLGRKTNVEIANGDNTSAAKLKSGNQKTS